MKGGSLSSNAVTDLVSQPAYNSLSKNFSNYMNSATGSRATKSIKSKLDTKCKLKCERCSQCNAKLTTGGNNNVFSVVSKAVTNALSFPKSTENFNVFKSNSAPAGYQYSNLRGNSAVAKSGGFAAKNMREYADNSSFYSLKNKKGGNNVVKTGLDYSTVKTTSNMYGQVAPRATPNVVSKLMAQESASSSPALQKFATFGAGVNSSISGNSQQGFKYASTDNLVMAGGKCSKKARSCGTSCGSKGSKVKKCASLKK
jgi:hypothetical protein